MADEETSKVVDAVLDLRGVPCPLSWARAKVRLEGLGRGAAMVLLLDDGRGLRDIPRAAEAHGYTVDPASAAEGHWRLRILV
jgi:TusA-related sulfurtransferase